MITNTTTTQIGDRIYFTNEVPMKEVTSITSFTDSIVGETVDRYFNKRFRYAMDGVIFSEWMDLTEENLTSIVFNDKADFVVECMYERAGADNTGELTFDGIHFTCNYTTVPLEGVLADSMFKDVIMNDYSLELMLNLVRKLYERGILPQYIERASQSYDAEDLIAFWKAICHFYSIILSFAVHNFEDIFHNEVLLALYLSQKGLILRGDEDLQQLQHLAETFFNQINRRGSIRVFDKQSEDIPVDGEFLRLIKYQSGDEFLWEVIPNHLAGWNMNNASPMCTTLTLHQQLNKAWENTADFVDLSKYPTSGTTLAILTDGDKEVLQISNVPHTESAGIIGDYESEKAIIVDPTLDYEVTFYVKQNTLNPTFTMKILGMNSDNDAAVPLDIVSGVGSETIFSKISLLKNDVYYFVRVIIFNKDKALLSTTNGKTNIKQGNNRKFAADTAKILPIIQVQNDNITDYDDNDLRVWDLKVKPLSTSHSNCFLQAHNFVNIWFKNRNNQLNVDELEEIMNNLLLPYNVKLKNIYL